MKYEPDVLDSGAVKAAGGSVAEDGSGVALGGWAVSTHKGPITADAELDRLKGQLGCLAAPEQFYGANTLRLEHAASGVALGFNALDALKGWVEDTSAPVQVGESEEWLRARQQDVQAHAAATLEYDWTYTTSYCGTAVRLASSSSADGSCAGGAAAAASSSPAASAAPAPRWEATSEQIPRALLASRAEPILFYDDLPLYESELDDHGSSRCSVKVRVMPRCWFVLLRFWLRVDRVLVRLRETRVFCRTDGPAGSPPTVLREVRHHEGTFAELRAAGAPGEGPAYADADTAAQALMAAAPVGVTHYRLERLVL